MRKIRVFSGSNCTCPSWKCADGEQFHLRILVSYTYMVVHFLDLNLHICQNKVKLFQSKITALLHVANACLEILKTRFLYVDSVKYENNDSFLVKHMWDPWSNWTKCDVECGIGLRYRSRNCRRNEICSGSNAETGLCNVTRCSPSRYHIQVIVIINNANQVISMVGLKGVYTRINCNRMLIF